MDSEFARQHESATAYFLDVHKSAVDPAARGALESIIRKLQILRGCEHSHEEGFAVYYEVGVAISDLFMGNAATNEEYARTYLKKALAFASRSAEYNHNRASVLQALGVSYTDSVGGDPSENKERAIGYFNEALSIFTKDRDPIYWALTMHGLGNALRDRIKGDPSKNQERAIHCFRQALTIRRLDTTPMKWAATMAALGNVYSVRIKGAPTENQALAIDCYNGALAVVKKDVDPMKWAMIMYGLGYSYAHLVDEDPSVNQERALGCYQEVLSVFGKDIAPMKWAMVMYALGAAFFARIDGDPLENQEQAVDCFNQALSIWKKDVTPINWAMTIYALGNVYAERIEGYPSQNQEKAIDCYDQALSIFKEESTPMSWAITVYALGNVYSDRIEGDLSQNQEAAIDYYNQALSVLAKDAYPMDWAMTMYGLGNVYSYRIQGNPSENQERAIVYFNDALSIWSRDVAPMDWAMTMHGLGNVYHDRIEGDPSESQEKSIHYFHQALSVWTEEVAALEWAIVMYDLGNAYSFRIEGDPSENQEKALDYYNQALTVRRKEVLPMDWAMTMHAMGYAYNMRIEGDPSENQEKAIDCYRQTLSVWEKDVTPLKWARAMHSLGDAYRGRNEGGLLENQDEAIRCYNKALTVFKREAAPMDWAMIMYALGNAYNEKAQYAPSANYEKAVHCYEQTLSVINAETEPGLYHKTLFALGHVLWYRGRHFGNREEIVRSLEIITSALELILDIDTGITGPGARKGYLRQFASSFHFAVSAFLSEKRHFDALYWMEKIRAKSLLEDVNLEHIDLPNPEIAQRAGEYWEACHEVRELRAMVSDYARLDQFGTVAGAKVEDRERVAPPLLQDPEFEAFYLDLKEHLRIRNRLLHELSSLAPDYVSLIRAQPLSERELHDLLCGTDRCAAVESFISLETASIHFLIAYVDGSSVGYRHIECNDSMSASLRDILIESFLIPYTMSRFVDFRPIDSLFREAGKLMQPVADCLSSLGIKRVYLSPHSFLQAIPLHGAILPRTNTYFAESFEVCYTPSLTMSHRLSRSKAHTGDKALTLFYSVNDSAEWAYLEHGERELEELGDIYGPDNVIALKDGDATLENLADVLKRESKKALLLNLTCHGEASSDGAYLYLSNGPVSHRDMIGKLDLGGLPLVILGACETGRSREWLESYEEYRALDSTLLQMGAKAVVSSFYRVSDSATLEILRRFHKNLSEGQTPSRAFHAAQECIIRDGFSCAESDGRTRGRKNKVASTHPDLPATHPYYWAFIKYGGTF